MLSVESMECRKCKVWKMRSIGNNQRLIKNKFSHFQFSISISHCPFSIPVLVTFMRSVENEACVIWKLTN